MEKHSLAIVLVALTVVVSGCIDGGEEELPEGDVVVTVGEMYFQQEDSDLPENELSAEVGDEIVFYNEGSVQHTVTIPEYGIDEDINPGDTVTVEADEAGEDLVVDCRLHNPHEATLTVEES